MKNTTIGFGLAKEVMQVCIPHAATIAVFYWSILADSCVNKTVA
jgi:hypothetical protein